MAKALARLAWLACVTVCAGAPAAVPVADKPEATTQTFLKANCVECHGPDVRKGKVALHDLSTDPKDAKAVALWGRVLEQLEVGRMPPEDHPAAEGRRAGEVIVSLLTSDSFLYRK